MAEKKKNVEHFDTKEVEARVEVEETPKVAEATETAPASAESAKNTKETKKAAKASAKSSNGKPNFFVRVWKRLVKFCKDTRGELKKVVWTPKAEVFKSFKLVIATVVAVGLCIAVVDTASSWIINSIAGLIG